MKSKQVLLFAIGPLTGALLGVVTIPIITWYFTQEDVGRMAMLQVALSFGTLFYSLGLDQAYVRDYHDTQNKPMLLKSAMLPGLLLLVTTLGGLLLLDGKLASWLFEVEDARLSLLVSLTLIAAFISRFLSLVLRMKERGLAFSMSQIMPKLLLLGIICIFVVNDTDASLNNLIIANSAALVFVCLIFCWNTRHEWIAGLKQKINVSQLLAMLRFGLPLIMGGVAFWGLTAIDKIFLRILSSYSELGIYSVSVSIAGAAAILQSVFSIVWAPVVYKWVSSGTGDIKNVYRVTRYVLLCVVIMFSTVGAGAWLLIHFLPPEYVKVQWVVVSCVGFPLLYTLSETTVVGINISRKTFFSMLSGVIAFIFNACVSWVVIPIYGAAGAAATTCAAFLLFLVLRTEFSIYLWCRIPRLLIYSYSVLLSVGAILSTLYGDEGNIFFVGFWLSVMVSGFVVFREELKEIKGFLLRRIGLRV